MHTVIKIKTGFNKISDFFGLAVYFAFTEIHFPRNSQSELSEHLDTEINT